MNWLILYYGFAVIGSFVARILWWSEEYCASDIWQELRLNWWGYCKEALTAGLGLGCSFLGGNRRLEAQSQAIDHLLHRLSYEAGHKSFWDLPEVEKERIRNLAKSRLEGQLIGFDDVLRALEASQKTTRRFAWAAGIAVWLTAPVKLLTISAMADSGKVAETITVTGPVDKSNLSLTWWNMPTGERLDVYLSFPRHGDIVPFLQLRNTDNDAHLGVGINTSAVHKNLTTSFMLRAFTNGTRGSPTQVQIMPSASYTLGRLSLGGYAMWTGTTGKDLWCYAPTASYRLGHGRTLTAEADYPGKPVYYLGFVQAVRW